MEKHTKTTRSGKPIRLKIWPELISYNPLLFRLPAKASRKNTLLVDFSRCKEIDTPALALLLVRILRIIHLSDDQTPVLIEPPIQKQLENHLWDLNFQQVIAQHNAAIRAKPQHPDLFERPICTAPRSVAVGNDPHLGVMYPLHFLNMTGSADRRQEVKALEDWLVEIFSHLSCRKNLNQLVIILREMAKNTADHTSGIAALGIEKRLQANGNQVLKFSYSDTGPGIHQSLWSQWADDAKIKRLRHQGVAESYRMALKEGFSTKSGNGINLGLGMSLIMQGSIRLGVDLSVFDADSRGLLTNLRETTHSEIRKNFFHLSTNMGFAYHGVLSL
jgi:hypothetical protein